MECCEEYVWLLVIGFLIAFLLAFGIGANDVANTFGTSVGAKVLTLRQACILATVFETLGSILIGAKVSGTIRKGILDPQVFEGQELELMLGYISALLGCCIWLMIATACGLPVSGTHSIVGSTIGMAIVSKGFSVIKWFEILKIASSWIISPLLSGLVSVLMFLIIKKLILTAKNPLKIGLAFLPIIYTITIFINIGGIMESEPPLLHLDVIPWWGKILIIVGISITVYLSVQFLLVPYLRKKIKRENKKEIELDTIIVNNSDMCKSAPLAQTEQMGDSVTKKGHTVTFPSSHPINNKFRRMVSMPANVDNDNTVNNTLDGVYLVTIGPKNKSFKHKSLKSVKTKQVTTDITKQVTSNQETITDSNQNSISSASKSNGRFTSIPVNNKDPIPETFQNLFHHSPSEEDELTNKQKENDENHSAETDKLALPHINNKDEQNEFEPDFSRSDPPETVKLFSFLQILTAIFGSFAHGGNDVSNAIGPLIGLYLVFKEGKVSTESSTPEWILLYGGFGISLGLWILGRKVIKTIGEDLTKITPSSGFVIELASAMTVLGASMLNIPVSSTHCKVGAVVFTGRVRSKESVDWSLFRNIIIAWAVTVPITCGIAAACQACLKLSFGLSFQI